mmetsp:Transcript_27154/g.43623  ORF Transcript_27154/g.43623 Transcript_27154/m.43623 type:complete len:234 (-) Transcript_27154:231-932(-)|eukprot:CAMPEP_0203762828 /NCGR_PEP_ID=MMETSP0098-20131031/15622_1 /ASSEMBLY_ACC=CAM_ASM_000208 /TAXON_ID=96639 /ORGANISM=" , Strain NY0313808BC1" /LENGTH=233 /DNA_ID=CAMNT_0050657387 /DNA_START=576 /DNA_END=1277 /DNA_ORIENTATION=-
MKRMKEDIEYDLTSPQYKELLSKRRRTWSPPEDELLVKAIKSNKTEAFTCDGGKKTKINWKAVASEISGRTPKQCRDRWNCVGLGIHKKAWTPEEDALLIRLQKIYNNQWVRIAKEFHGRNDNMIKSRFRLLVEQQYVNRISTDYWGNQESTREDKPMAQESGQTTPEQLQHSLYPETLPATTLTDYELVQRERWAQYSSPSELRSFPEGNNSDIELAQWCKTLFALEQQSPH